MRERRSLGMMQQLVAIQHARREAAQAAVSAATTAERDARRREEAARNEALNAHQQWQDHVRQSGFSPEYGIGLSALVIERDRELDGARTETERRSSIRKREQRTWQELLSQARRSEDSARRLKRRIERRAEERRLGQLNDRITQGWFQR